ncbi:hypothetical protein [Mycetocola miduiensis]|uniref:Uncharacterized protein n=1 Tax=Mycetocola miduiensis TaxID=995034 RepID=A0A1I5CQ51_9MICO|nr:hypothetical protein [Mycetocola miduiensis]SFN89057.1 hypothetical protein SAMN05216219_2475 [Mycetocola miduiensis]
MGVKTAAAFSHYGYPQPLQRIAELLEIRLDSAPGDVGFELHARLREGADVSAVVGDQPPSSRRSRVHTRRRMPAGAHKSVTRTEVTRGIRHCTLKSIRPSVSLKGKKMRAVVYEERRIHGSVTWPAN